MKQVIMLIEDKNGNHIVHYPTVKDFVTNIEGFREIIQDDDEAYTITNKLLMFLLEKRDVFNWNVGLPAIQYIIAFIPTEDTTLNGIPYKELIAEYDDLTLNGDLYDYWCELCDEEDEKMTVEELETLHKLLYNYQDICNDDYIIELIDNIRTDIIEYIEEFTEKYS